VTPKEAPTKWQAWMRHHSIRLGDSFTASAPIRHAVTKGQSRELQILDVLRIVLPERLTVDANTVVIDQNDAEAPSFDGVILDRINLPLIWQENTIRVAMLESVAALVEVKSTLNSTEVGDIFRKSKCVRSMLLPQEGPWAGGPLVTAFAYTCRNMNLTFYDYARRFWLAKEQAPSVICLLNKAVFALVQPVGGTLVPTDLPTPSAIPALLRSGEDSLLLYVYLLSRWGSKGTPYAEAMRNYSNNFFAKQAAFYFDVRFLELVAGSDPANTEARRCFTRRPAERIEVLYADAKQRTAELRGS
jgi:hypothetical protein